MPERAPSPDAAVDDMEDPLRAEALDQTPARGGPLTRGADDRHRLLGIEAGRQLGDVVPALEDGPGDVTGVPLVLVAHVEDLQARVGLQALAHLLHRLALDPVGGPLLAPPARQASVGIARDV